MPESNPSEPRAGIGAGLCDSCTHQQIVRNTRGSSFSLCRRSRSDPGYPRYPRVPVMQCPGYDGDGASGLVAGGKDPA